MATTIETKRAKQTAANSRFLRAAKRLYDEPTYGRVARLVNSQGEDAALKYLREEGLVEDPVTFMTHREACRR